MRWRDTLILLGAISLWAPLTSQAACRVDAETLAFGEYRPLDTGHVDSLSRISVICDGDAGRSIIYRLRLNEGSGGSYQPRSMLQGGDRLQYNLFKNSSRSQIWGDGSAGTEIVVGAINLRGNGEFITRRHIVFARLFASQSVRAGSYVDVLQVTLETCETPEQCQVVMVVPLKIG